jgi:hypothetical protein
MATRKTQSSMAVNAKLSSINLLAVATAGDGATYIEGQPVALSATTYKADAPTTGTIDDGSASTVFLNWVDSSRSDVEFNQGDPFDDTAPTTSIQAGGLSCLVGNGCEVGLPASAFEGGTAPTIGQYLRVGASGLFEGVTASAGLMAYGRVHRVDQSKYYFLFTSQPFVVAHA